MASPRRSLSLLSFASFLAALSACSEPVSVRAPAAPSLAVGGVGRPVVLVDPRAGGNGSPVTIQEGIDLVAPGGRVLVLPGTYPESLVINKGVTLEGIADGSGSVRISSPGQPWAAVLDNATSPVVIRNIAVQVNGENGVGGEGALDLTLDGVSITKAGGGPSGTALAAVYNSTALYGARARFTVWQSTIDGGAADLSGSGTFGIRVVGDVDASIVGNVVRNVALGSCIGVSPWLVDNSGETNAEIVGNTLDGCYPLVRGAIGVGLAFLTPPPMAPVAASGIVNVVGNTVRNTTAACRPVNGIAFSYYTGRIERNRILGVVQGCTPAVGNTRPAGIYVGYTRADVPGASVVVRFNDIVGNAQAGLRIGASQHAAIDASCNWWGSASGPSGLGTGAGDAVVVDAGAPAPVFAPFAASPIADTPPTSCT